VTQIVNSVYAPDPNLKRLHYTFEGGTKILNLRSFLSANAVRAHYFVRDVERQYDLAKSKDKDYTPGQYSNVMKKLMDYIRDWINKRY
jgi:hypothetical protein